VEKMSIKASTVREYKGKKEKKMASIFFCACHIFNLSFFLIKNNFLKISFFTISKLCIYLPLKKSINKKYFPVKKKFGF
jgi:hypothetical protein